MNKKTLIIGASLNEARYSNIAIRRLREENLAVRAYGRTPGLIGDVTIETELITNEEFHTVSLYINPKNQESLYDYIISLKPERILFNPGSENPELAKLANEASIKVEHGCTLVMLRMANYFEEIDG